MTFTGQHVALSLLDKLRTWKLDFGVPKGSRRLQRIVARLHEERDVETAEK